jgi:hypothetical protein
MENGDKEQIFMKFDSGKWRQEQIFMKFDTGKLR